VAKEVFFLHLVVTLNTKKRKTVEASNCIQMDKGKITFNLRLSEYPKQISIFIKQDVHIVLCFAVLATCYVLI